MRFQKIYYYCSRALKAVGLFRVPGAFEWIHSIGLINLSSKISSGGSHTEHWRRCSYIPEALMKDLTPSTLVYDS